MVRFGRGVLSEDPVIFVGGDRFLQGWKGNGQYVRCGARQRGFDIQSELPRAEGARIRETGVKLARDVRFADIGWYYDWWSGDIRGGFVRRSASFRFFRFFGLCSAYGGAIPVSDPLN